MDIELISQPADAVAPPNMNSIGIWTNEIARSLADSGQHVSVYARKGLARQEPIGGGVQTRYITTFPSIWVRSLNNALEQRYGTDKKPFFSSPFYQLDYSLQVALDLRRRGARIAHIQNFSQFASIIRALNPSIQIGLHMRCEWLTQLDAEMIERRLRQVDHIFGVSDYITEKIRQRFPQHAAKCATIPNGVDVQQFAPPARSAQGERRLLMVGRISPEKGVHVLLQAFPQVARRFPDVQLDLVGSLKPVSKDMIVDLSEEEQVRGLEIFYDGAYLDHLQRLVPADLRERVHFTGHVNYARTLGYYQNAYLLVNPSLSESFGRSLIEANACGLPVVAARAGGMPALVDEGRNGLLVEPGDPAALADALTSLLEAPRARDAMGACGRQRVLQQYTWPKIAQRLLEAYGG